MLLVAAGVLVLAVSETLLVALLPPAAVPAAAAVLVLVLVFVFVAAAVVVDAAGVALDVAPVVGEDAMTAGLAEPVRFVSNCPIVSP